MDAASRDLSAAKVSVKASESGLSLDHISLDTKTVCALIADRRFNFSVLVGHSKGNLVLSEALFALEQWPAGARRGLSDETWIVKISAAVAMPPRFKNCINVMGTIDWFGTINSRREMTIDKQCANAWHHTNTEALFHLPVTRTMRELIGERGIRV